MGSIPPISSTPPSYGSSNDWISQLQTLLNEYREDMKLYMNDPSAKNLDTLTKLLHQITNFINEHRSDIENQAKNEGWPSTGPDSVENYLEGTLRAIQGFEQEKKTSSLDLLNEQLTEVNWFMHHKPGDAK